MSNTLYNRLKFITQIALPAAGTLYFTLAGIWNWSSGDEVVGSIVALDTFLGVMLQLSSNAYANSEERFDGAINVAETDDKKTFSLDLKSHPDDLDSKDQVVFKVNKG